MCWSWPNSSFPLGGGEYVRLPNNAGSGLYYVNLTVQWLFEAASTGTHTFYFLGDETVGDWSVYDRNMTLVYIPSAYGTNAPSPRPTLRQSAPSPRPPTTRASSWSWQRWRPR